MTNPKTSRGGIGLLSALLAGAVSAVTFVVAAALFMAPSPLGVVGYISAIPLFMTGFGAGAASSLIAATVSSGTIFLLMGSGYAVLAYLAIIALPALGLIAMSMRYRSDEAGKIYWYPEGFMLTALSLYCCVGFIIVAMMAGSSGHDLLEVTTASLQKYLKTAVVDITPDNVALFNKAISNFAEIMPIVMGGIWMALVIVCIISAQIILRQQNWLLRAPFTLKDIYLPNWLIGALITAGLCGILGAKPLDYYGMNLSLMLCMPFFFVGLTVVHAFAATIRYRRTALTIFYLFVFVMPKIEVLVFLAVLGVLDQGLNLRKKLTPRLTLN